MIREFVGMVSEEEKCKIMTLHERQAALRELLMTINENTLKGLYEKIVNDLTEVRKKSEVWWREMSLTKKWKSVEGGQWTIDFSTNEIYILHD